MRPFEPFFRNAHLATVAGNFWTRPELESRWPVTDVFYEPEPGVRVLVRMQSPAADVQPCGEVILVHGLEGSSESGYARSMAAAALEAGFAVHRLNMRGCGASPWNAQANYHSGQTGDSTPDGARTQQENIRPSAVRDRIFARRKHGSKTCGRTGAENGPELFEGICAVSAPDRSGREQPPNFRGRTNFFYRKAEIFERSAERARAETPFAWLLTCYLLEPLAAGPYDL